MQLILIWTWYMGSHYIVTAENICGDILQDISVSVIVPNSLEL